MVNGLSVLLVGLGTGVEIPAVINVDSVSPDSGSVYGGQLVTLTGVGFDPEGSTVTLNAADCAVTEITETQV